MRMAQYVIRDNMPRDESAEVRLTCDGHEALLCATELLCPSARFWLMEAPHRLLSTPSAHLPDINYTHSNTSSQEPDNAAIFILEATPILEGTPSLKASNLPSYLSSLCNCRQQLPNRRASILSSRHRQHHRNPCDHRPHSGAVRVPLCVQCHAPARAVPCEARR